MLSIIVSSRRIGIQSLEDGAKGNLVGENWQSEVMIEEQQGRDYRQNYSSDFDIRERNKEIYRRIATANRALTDEVFEAMKIYQETGVYSPLLVGFYDGVMSMPELERLSA